MPVGHNVNVGGDWVDGFQVGKAAALSDWQFRKEQEEFETLCHRLYQRNWARADRVRNPEKHRRRLREWRAKNRERTRELDRRRQRAKRLETVQPCVCEECGGTWLPVDGRRSSRFCGRKCRNRWHGKRRKRSRGIRNMQLRPTILRILRREPWLTTREIVRRDSRMKPGSVATTLTILRSAGKVVSKGKRNIRWACRWGE